jgi:hypothetical protein
VGLGFIIYYLHREIRNREGSAREFLCTALNSIMATIFVIVLNQYPKAFEHDSPNKSNYKVISMVLNIFF